MKNHTKTIFALIVIFLFTIYSNQLIAQQSKVDSAIYLFNKSSGNNKLDTASFNKAFYLLVSAKLTDSQIEQIETIASNYKHKKEAYTAYDIRAAALESMSKTDVDKAIADAKLQIEKLDKLNSPDAAYGRKSFIYMLRLPFRNSNRLEEGFQYYTQKLKEYKTRNDSLCIVECYHVLGGFYGVSGLLDLAIYNLKKSITYVDTVHNKRRLTGNLGFIGYHYLLKGDKKECLKFSRLSVRETLKSYPDGSYFDFLIMANMMVLSNQLDSAAYYIEMAKKDPDSNQGNATSYSLQTESLLKIQAGDLEEADVLLKKCWQVINERNISVHASSVGTLAAIAN